MSVSCVAARPSGLFVAVVGPSGAGKDTLIRRAAERFCGDERFRFVRRTVTRAADPDAEDHDTLDEAAFDALEADGRFSLTWRAHGLAYGLPSDITSDLASGCVVIANLSRRSLGEAVRAFGRVAVVTVTAPDAVLIERIVARGREDRDAAQKRVARHEPHSVPCNIVAHTIVENDGPLELASQRFVVALEGMRR